MFHRHIRVKSNLLTLSTMFFGLTLSYSLPVFAQGDSVLEEVTVTGSRIVRRDMVSNSPIVTIEADQFEQQTGLNIESYLNQLPQYNPAASPVTTNQDVQITPVNSVGVATISLRGFGPNRSLALVDGKRTVPVNALQWTDINGIPSALIQRTETITGGASAVYGADAVGGVTNFILRKDYEGFEFDGQYGIQEAGDGEESRINMLFGANFADDRGNVTFGAERYDRKTAFARERDFYTDRWANPDAPGYFFFVQGTNAYSCNPVCPQFGALKALFGGQNPSAWFAAFTPDAAPMPTYIDVQFNPDGTIWTSGFPFQTTVGQSRAQLVKDGMQYASRWAIDSADPAGENIIDGIKWNNTEQYASGPQDRYSIFASGHFDVTDKVTINAGATFAESRTATLLFGTNAISGWETSIPYDPATDSPIDPTLTYDAATLAAVAADPAAFFAANPNPGFIPTGSPGAQHPVPAELAWLLNSRADPTARWQPQWNPDTSLPDRQTHNTITQWEIHSSVDFEIPWRDWTGEIYASHGRAETYNEAGGNMSLTRYRALANYPDYGRGVGLGSRPDGTGNQIYTVGTTVATAEVVPAIRPEFGVGDFECTSGLYNTYFGGDQPMSEDCFNALNAVLQTRTEITQNIVEVNLQGGVYDLPAGEVRAAIGYQHRNVDGKFNPDILQSQDSFQDQVIGVYPTGYLDASTHVNDYYIEALIPIVADRPYMQKFELETGARYSFYQEARSKEWTYKVLANWEVTDWLRLRGGYNRATRAPNLGELFLNRQEVFTGGGNFGDPCSVRANAPWGAGGTTLADDEVIGANEPLPALAAGQTQAGADYTKQLCDAMMGPVASDDYYEGIIGGVDQLNDFVEQGGGGGFAWVLQEGNKQLKPETADTWTAGFVASSPWDNPWLSGLSLVFDWYKVDIKDAIMTYSIDYANYRCFGLGFANGIAPATQAQSQACRLVPRNKLDGAALNTVLSYDNQATMETSGFDVGLDWFANIADLGWDVPGSLGFHLTANILDTYKTRQSSAPYDVETEWKGSLGPNLPGTQAGAYDYRIFSSLTYNRDNWSVTLRWRYLPPVYTAGHAEQLALIANNARVTAGGDGLLLSYTPDTVVENDSYSIFDLAGTWDYNETFSFRGGITNLLDTDPVYSGTTAGYAPGSNLAVCNGAPGCTDPTSYSVKSLGGFSGGYYDTQGRRFFLGLKARF